MSNRNRSNDGERVGEQRETENRVENLIDIVEKKDKNRSSFRAIFAHR